MDRQSNQTSVGRMLLITLASIFTMVNVLNLQFSRFGYSPSTCLTTTPQNQMNETNSSPIDRGGTIVTAFYEGPSKHTLEKYKSWAANFLTLQDPMVIFTTPSFAPFVEEHRAMNNATNKTKIVLLDLNKTEAVNMFDIDFWKDQHAKDRHGDRHKSYHVYWVWLSKLEFVRKAVEENPFHSEFFAWVDIGYVRTRKWLGQRLLQMQNVPSALQEDQVMMLDVHHNGHVGAGFIGGFPKGLLRYSNLFYSHLVKQQSSFIGREEPMLDETCLVEENLCQLVLSGKWYDDHRWYYMLPFLILGQEETEASLYVPSKYSTFDPRNQTEGARQLPKPLWLK